MKDRGMDDLLRRVEAGLAGRYAIDSELGRGGMAVVYRARDLRHQRDVAVKVLPPQLASAIGHQRFLHEIRLAAGLAHPYIVPILDSGEAEGLVYYVMPVVEGETLQARLRRGPLPVAEALAVGREIAEALAHAHDAGIVHRDVKPSNVLLTRKHALLSDFGVARAAGAGDDERLTGTGVIIGTPAYMSPQQALSENDLDGSADQYSLACVLYEMLAGLPPFRGATAQETLLSHATRPPPPLRGLRPDVPAAAASAVERALSKAPEDRFPSMEAFRDALDDAGEPTARRWSASRRAAVVLLVGTLAAASAWGLSRRYLDATTQPGGTAEAAADGRVAVLPCRASGDTLLGRQAAMDMEWMLDGFGGLDVTPYSQVETAGFPDADSMPSIAARLRVASVVRCQLSRVGTDSVELRYDLWSDSQVSRHTRMLPTKSPEMVDVEPFAIALATLLTDLRVSGEDLFVPTEDVEALRLFTLGYRAFIGERFFEADTLFAEAVFRDSSFALARWRQADVRRWMLEPGPEGTDLRQLYAEDRERLGRRNALYLSAFAVPRGAASFHRFESILDSLPYDAYAHLLYGDELLHRGPLVGLEFGLEAAERQLRRATELNPQFGPAWDHLAIAQMLQGKEAAADSALIGLERAATPSSRDYPVLWRHAWRERFRPAEAKPHREMLVADTAGLRTYARYGVRLFDLPDLQLVLGIALADRARPGSADWHSGTNAMALAHASLGRPTAASNLWKRAADASPRAAAAEAELFARQWAVVPAALGLEGLALDPEDAAAALGAIADDTTAAALRRARAAWTLALHAARDAGAIGSAEFERRGRLVAELTETHGLDPLMSFHLEAVEAARDRRWRAALEASAPLVAYDSAGNRDRPFNRAAFYLGRGDWYAELARERGDPALADSARAAWIWHLNTDLEGVGGREVQAGEIDGVFGTHARLRTARLADEFARRDDGPRWREIACREAGAAARRLEGAEDALKPVIVEVRAILARNRCVPTDPGSEVGMGGGNGP